MDKQFEKFTAKVPKNFKELMIAYWVEKWQTCREDVLYGFCDDAFRALNKRIAGTVCHFNPKLGYLDSAMNGTLCFEALDNTHSIPVCILEEK